MIGILLRRGDRDRREFSLPLCFLRLGQGCCARYCSIPSSPVFFFSCSIVGGYLARTVGMAAFRSTGGTALAGDVRYRFQPSGLILTYSWHVVMRSVGTLFLARRFRSLSLASAGLSKVGRWRCWEMARARDIAPSSAVAGSGHGMRGS